MLFPTPSSCVDWGLEYGPGAHNSPNAPVSVSYKAIKDMMVGVCSGINSDDVIIQSRVQFVVAPRFKQYGMCWCQKQIVCMCTYTN